MKLLRKYYAGANVSLTTIFSAIAQEYKSDQNNKTISLPNKHGDTSHRITNA